MTGTLYVVATPIGNLEDITLRAIRTLREVNCVACEDTRISRQLLEHFGIQKPLISYYFPRERDKMKAILDRLLDGQSVALITDSGTPGISDPGGLLVAEAHSKGIRVEPIPGPCSATAALSAAGFDDDGYYFAGFLPDSRGKRKEALLRLAVMPVPVLIFAAPHDVRFLIQEALQFFGDRPVLLARELTKKFEEVKRTTLAALLDGLPESPRGEFVIVIAPGSVPDNAGERTLQQRYQDLLAQGCTRSQAVKRLSQEHSLTKRRIAELLGAHGD